MKFTYQGHVRESFNKKQSVCTCLSAIFLYGHKLKHRKFCLNMRKNFFTLRVTEPWNRLLREVVESPSLEIFETCLDKVLCSLL